MVSMCSGQCAVCTWQLINEPNIQVFEDCSTVFQNAGKTKIAGEQFNSDLGITHFLLHKKERESL